MSKFEVGSPIPDSIGARGDMLHEVREVRLAMEKEAAAVKKRETEINDSIIRDLSKSDDTGAAGRFYRVQIKEKRVPKPEDWQQIHAYIRDNDRFDLLQKRVSDKAVMDMLEAGEEIPGMETALIPSVSLTKL